MAVRTRAARLAAGLILGFSLVVAFATGSASGGTVSVVGSTVKYEATAGEINALGVKIEGTDYVFNEGPGVTVTAGVGCTVTLGAGRCPVGPIRLQVSLLDGDDSVRLDPSLGRPLVDASVQGGPGADTMINDSALSSQLNGDEGSDVLTGGSGPDFLLGGDGDDRITGRDGSDQLYDGAGSDQVEGGPGMDSFRPASDPDGADRYRGGEGRDRIDFFDRKVPITVTLNDLADDGASCPGPGCERDDIGSDVESLAGTRAADRLTGSSGPQSISGGDGADLVDGLGGTDFVSGGDGDDVLAGGAGNDEVDGGRGADSLDGGPGDDVVRPDFADDSTDTIGGGPGFDSTDTELAYEPVQISLNGVADDRVRNPESSAPPDNVKPDVEAVMGSDGADLLTGSGSANLLIGGGGADRLVGGGGADELHGGRGADLLEGGRGSDLLAGGSGPDRFRARDSRRDELRCGAGLDRGVADRTDRRGPDCDKVKAPRRKGKKR